MLKPLPLWSRPVVFCDHGVRPNSLAKTTSVLSSIPRCFKSRINPEIGLSTAWHSGAWLFISSWASQAPLPPPALQIWMKRTPFSARRRASSS